MPTAAIIGAGPAGSVAAILLARAGWGVTLIEQHQFPRDKVCGECVSALGIELIARLGLRDRIRRRKPVELTHASLYADSSEHAELALSATMWGISRERLDAELLRAAQEAGARVLQPVRCESFEKKEVRLRDLGSNRRWTLEAEQILVADGKGALLPQRPKATSDFGIKAHFVDVALPKRVIALFGFRRHYGGVAAIEENKWNLAYSAPAKLLSDCNGDLDALFASLVLKNGALARAFERARRISEWLTSPLPRFAVARAWPPRMIPLGNAAAALEPIGGEGIGLAMRSAELAAESLIADPAAEHRPVLRRAFKALWNVRTPACRLAAKVLSSPSLAGPTVQLLANNERLAAIALRLMGKPRH